MVRIRQRVDGGLWIARPDKETENVLNQNYIREDNTWYPQPSGQTVEGLKGTAKGQTATIVGKGPSLNRLTPSVFSNGPIICINESIKIIDKMYPNLATFGIQTDGELRERCRPQNATLLLGIGCRGWYSDLGNRIVFNPKQDLGTKEGQITAIYALHFCKLMGCVGVNMVAFDAATTQDIGYAEGKPIKYPGEKVAGERFLKHKAMIEDVASDLGLKLNWVKIT